MENKNFNTPDKGKGENRDSFQERLKNLSERERMNIDFAYDLAKESHRPQARDAGERYFEHLRDVALILVDECGVTDPDLIIAALLHDSVEDSATFGNRTMLYSKWKEVAYFRLSKVFNERVARIVIALTKPTVDGVEIKTKEEADIIYFKGLKETGEEALLLKMCDRLHNLRSLQGTTQEKQLKTTRETEEKYYPFFEEASDLPLLQKERVELLAKIKEQVAVIKNLQQ